MTVKLRIVKKARFNLRHFIGLFVEDLFPVLACVRVHIQRLQSLLLKPRAKPAIVVPRRRREADFVPETHHRNALRSTLRGQFLACGFQLFGGLVAHVEVPAEQSVRGSLIARTGRESRCPYKFLEFLESRGVLGIVRPCCKSAPKNQCSLRRLALDWMSFEVID